MDLGAIGFKLISIGIMMLPSLIKRAKTARNWLLGILIFMLPFFIFQVPFLFHPECAEDIKNDTGCSITILVWIMVLLIPLTFISVAPFHICFAALVFGILLRLVSLHAERYGQTRPKSFWIEAVGIALFMVCIPETNEIGMIVWAEHLA
ncbi:MAG: hypothetical protein AAGE80_09470 [Pseudomonadota bacterium]